MIILNLLLVKEEEISFILKEINSLLMNTKISKKVRKNFSVRYSSVFFYPEIKFTTSTTEDGLTEKLGKQFSKIRI